MAIRSERLSACAVRASIVGVVGQGVKDTLGASQLTVGCYYASLSSPTAVLNTRYPNLASPLCFFGLCAALSLLAVLAMMAFHRVG